MFFLDIGRDYVRSYLCKSDKADLGIINKLYEDMVAEALKDVEVFKVSPDEMIFEKSVEIRYQGQYHVLEIHLPETGITAQVNGAVLPGLSGKELTKAEIANLSGVRGPASPRNRKGSREVDLRP